MNKTKQPELYNVGITKFDKEHQQLVQMINAFYLESTDKEQDRVAQKLIISLLVKLVRTHFNGEEEFMRRIKYPDLDKHQQCHRVIYTQLLDLEHRFQVGSYLVANHALQFFAELAG